MYIGFLFVTLPRAIHRVEYLNNWKLGTNCREYRLLFLESLMARLSKEVFIEEVLVDKFGSYVEHTI